MADKVWKQAERRVAALFGTTRTPLSGGNGRQTRSDTLHPRLYIESKYRQRFALVDLFIETMGKAAKEGKLPVVVLVEKRQRLMFAVVPLKCGYLWKLMEELQQTPKESQQTPKESQDLRLEEEQPDLEC